MGGSRSTTRRRAGRKLGRRLTLNEVRWLMGVPEGMETPALLMSHRYAVLGNGVPLPLGLVVARAVKRSLVRFSKGGS